MDDLVNLERLAKNAIEASERLRTEKPTRKDADAAYGWAVAFATAAKPVAVLALIAELRAARRVIEDARGARGGALLAESIRTYDQILHADRRVDHD